MSQDPAATIPTVLPQRPLGHRPSVALVGNPNTGKTTLFNALAGMRQRVGNYPGVTVETKKGQVVIGPTALDLIDLPGTYSLAARSPDEMVAVDVVLGRQAGEARPDAILAIVDAANLERNLYLTTQAFDLGIPVVIALNMIDVAESQGIRIDVDRLAVQLGCPVVPIQANKGKGIDRLVATLAAAIKRGHSTKAVPFPTILDEELEQLRSHLAAEVPAFLARRILLDAGGYAEAKFVKASPELAPYLQQARERLIQGGFAIPAGEARARYAWIRQAVSNCIQRPAVRPVTWTDRIDRVLTHRIWGTLVFSLLMFLVFEAIFSWARPLMDLISAGKDLLAEFHRNWLPPGPLTSLLVDGILEGVGSVLVFLPQILILFGFLAILEDCGYMARAAFLMDRLMSRCGLSGKSFIPMLSSLACAVPGILSARVIENRRDRLATILVAPLMSCSARLPIYTLLIAAFLTAGHAWWVPGAALFGLYALGLVAAPLVALLLKRTLLRGETPVFVMEMPLYKWPSVRTVARRMGDCAWAFVYRAGTMILAAMVLVWALLYFPDRDPQGQSYPVRIAELDEQARAARASAGNEGSPAASQLEQARNELYGAWKRQSCLGRMGRWLEPAVRPLGWDWRVGMAVLASFPAREVVVGTLGIIYNQGEGAKKELDEAEAPMETTLAQALRGAVWEDSPNRPVFSMPVALSVMVFFAFCCQCVSTLAVIRRETNGWLWPAFTFSYMTVLAYVAALVTYQVGSLFC